MQSLVTSLLERWPLPLVAGALFFALWVPIVLISAGGVWLKNRIGLMAPVERSFPWWKTTASLLALGLPIAIGFGLLFTLRGFAGGGIVLTIVIAAICIALVVFLLPRLNRW